MIKDLLFEVVEGYKYDEFKNEVQKKLNDKWELHGHLIAFPNYIENDEVKSVKYIQAFIKDNSQRRQGGFTIGRRDE
jgi:hypothetical protein